MAARMVAILLASAAYPAPGPLVVTASMNAIEAAADSASASPRNISSPPYLNATPPNSNGGCSSDALATALVVAGAYGVRFLADLPEWSAYLVSGGRAQMIGPAFS